MRGSVIGVLACAWGVASASCRSTTPSPAQREEPPAPSASAPSPSPSRAAIAALERELQTTRLAIPARRRHLPRLAFGAGALARLRDHDVQVLDDQSLAELATLPLEQPRAVVSMADGAVVAVGGGGFARWERGKPAAPPGARIVLLPGAELYPDAREPDLLWVLEPDGEPPTLYGYRLGASSVSGLLAPERVVQLRSPRGGTFGVTREGVWLYLTPRRIERLAPSGLELPAISQVTASTPGWALPARRVDQSLWVDEAGTLTRALVSPVFKSLGTARSVGAAYAADVGDEGRLLAVISVTGAGPRFELALFDGELRERGRSLLAGDAPNGESEWVRLVTRNRELAVAPRSARVAVGGPDRLTIFDGEASVVLSMPIE
ncbi:MAG: hypothetical protein EOO73_24815 [Myxococcales bacterium]|nr:MAG: hypothetical protein EOO73_24815 [Myxococcales bacterium]